MLKKNYASLILLFISINIGSIQKIAQAQTPVTPVTTTKQICPAQLSSAINTIINHPQFSRVRWGILVKPLSSEKILYSQDSQKYFISASNMKLFTTAAALQKLGADFRIRTSIYDEGNGVLRVVGRGDPSFKNAQLTILSKQLYQQGIRQINQLIVDDSYFQGEVVNSSWEWEDIQADYGAPINSFILNENATVLTFLPQTIGEPLKLKWTEPTEAYRWKIENNSVTTEADKPSFVEVNRDLKGQILRIKGQLAINSQPEITGLAVFDPVANFIRQFRQNLAKEGITVKETLSSNLSKNDKEIAAVESPPLSELLLETNVNSNNLYAEALLRSLAIKKPEEKNQNTADVGLQVVRETLTQLGVAPAGYVIVDGSGLSRKNLTTPAALVQLLQGIDKSPQAAVFRASLPISGVKGSLKNRFLNTAAAGIVQAKTGSMTGISALSGYMNAPNYEPLVFSIMVNQSEQPGKVMRTAIDEIVVLLSELKRC
ncbi:MULTISPECIES: D-alanyl-D-alanine carboxypeptidase/D-alanyl-D-alanine-endopeptidase [unclassified Dolichospermum]|uniref:D-alanyl-D-alanine carboxypeptidase/D-alanyl-D-alanine endopeptidase n=1 Tax=unclassified Dolichospermum TaxID=2622029 RepID=UPI001448679A|nr:MULTISPECIES: D-alanyl-D-alanine carboxypeptidase/D-alanyl-D-alanine-endopeptidase [unclassified Dolichospermum]MTJ15706.1 D-alanyl-D-alanine carboxypeptidase/D-alanyl-D-alanine-endopeptidase [Dolichospermum sp. UHCC 0299]MTJ38895.1 D-alanyl-D-alanine carboxypeptidase/D-alanyl-D-alanine-endopeptidase [Dolichospermum sp. UHCC 0406]